MTAIQPMEARVLLSAAPTLTVVLSSTSVVETNFSNGIPATVQRADGDLSQAVTVSLASSDTSEATVPETVTIAAGAMSASFFVMPVDDALLDGSQTAQITASAPGYTYSPTAATGPAGLDTTFGTNGYSTTPLSWSLSSAYPDMLLQSDGSIVSLSQTPGTGTSWSLTRKLADGTNDSGFGNAGLVTTTVANSSQIVPTSVALQSDGKILAAGYAVGGVNAWEDLLVVRYNTDGSLDGTFGSGGIARLERATTTRINDVTVLGDGSILLAGTEITASFLAKLTSAGALDVSFGSAGTVSTAIPNAPFSYFKSVIVQSDGKLLGVGSVSFTSTNSGNFSVVRYLANGTIDTSFDFDGMQQIDTNFTAHTHGVANSAILQANGKLVIVGTDRPSSTTNDNWVIARLNANGSVDTTFSGDGVASLDFNGAADSANDVVQLPDGRLLVMGEGFVPGNGHDLAFARFNIDGTLDTSFDGDGKLLLPNWTGTVFEQVWAGELNAAGQLVFLSGYSSDMRVGRLNLSTLLPARDVLTVTDNETLTVSIVPTTVAENAGAVTGTVIRSNTGDLSSNLQVTLLSTDTTELTVPATVEILAGQTSASFAINVVDDDITDGTQTVTIRANAAGYISVADTLSITDNDTNVAPVVSSQNLSTSEDTVKNGTVTGTDADGNPLTFSLVTNPVHGQVTLNSNGTFAYTPAANYNGNDSFQFRAFDGRAFSNTGTVFLTVQAVNDAPVANDDSYTLNEDSVFSTSIVSQPVTSVQMTSDPGDWIGQGQSYNLSSGITASAANNGSYVRVRYQNPTVGGDDWDIQFESPGFNTPLTVGTYLGATRYPFNPEGTPGLSVTGHGRGSNTLTGFFTIHAINVSPSGQLQSFSASFEQHSEGSTPAMRGTVQYNYTAGGPAGILANDTDADGNALVASVVNGPQHGTVALNPNGTFSYTPNANYNGSDSFTYVAGDGPLLSNIATVSLTVNSVEDMPSIANQTFTVEENTPPVVSLGAVVASDGDAGQTLTYAITNTTHPGAFAIDAQTGELTLIDGSTLNYEQVSSAIVTVTVTDSGNPALSSSAEMTVNITDVNDRPVITTESLSVNENAANGTSVGTIVAVDQDAGQTLSYHIIDDTSGGAFALNPSTGELTVADGSLLNFETGQTPMITVGVVDSASPALSTIRQVTVFVNDVNEAPTLFAPPFSVDENAFEFAIVGTVNASDVDAGQTLTFSITDSTHPGAFAIHPEYGVIYVVDGSLLNYETAQSATVTVTATDNGNPALATSIPVTIAINDKNEAPTIADQSFAVVENSANGSVVGTVVASDVDAGQSLIYAIGNSSLPGAFAINAQTGQITVADASMLNYEAVQSVTLNVGVQDNGTPLLAAFAQVTIAITNVNDVPVIANQTFSIREYLNQGETVGNVIASDEDPGQTLTYLITSSTLPDAFMIMPSTGRILVSNAFLLDHETVPSVTLTIRATDNGNPARFADATVTVNINDVNESPMMAAQTFSVVENAVNGTVVGTVIASDVDAGQALTYEIFSSPVPGAFSINAATGQITVANGALLNYESQSSIELALQVTDNGTPVLGTFAPITINLVNVNEAPAVPNRTFTLAENTAAGTSVGTVSATDPDAGQSLTFAITGGNTNNAFAINATTGVVTVNNAAAINFEASPQFSLTVTATDNGSPVLSGSATVTVNLTNVNEAPVVTPVTFSLAENTANGTTVGTVATTDQDAGQTRTFAITGGNTNNAFAINATTGVLTVNNAAALNFETTPVFSLTVTATDNGTPALSGSATVTVNLLNVNESPVVTPRAFTINENSNNGVVIGTISATDPDAGQSRTFAITGGNTNNAFAINATTGVLTVNNSAALNFETTPQFSLTITATDNGSPAKSGSATVTVSLQNVNEAPVVPTQSLAVKTKSKAGAVVGTVVSSDPDAGQTRTYSIISGNGSASKPVFAINATTGVITVQTASSVASSGIFTLGIRVTDSGSPALSTTGTVTIYVNSTGTVPAGGSLAANAQSTSAASTSSPVTASIPLVVDTSKSAKTPPVTTATGTIQAYQALVLATKRKSTIQFIADWLKRRS